MKLLLLFLILGVFLPGVTQAVSKLSGKPCGQGRCCKDDETCCSASGVAVLQILLSVALTVRAVAHPTTLSAALTVRAVAHQIILSAVPTMPVVHQTSLSVAATTVVQLEQHAVRVAVDAALLG